MQPPTSRQSGPTRVEQSGSQSREQLVLMRASKPVRQSQAFCCGADTAQASHGRDQPRAPDGHLVARTSLLFSHMHREVDGACGPPGNECANDRLDWSRPKARTIECTKKEIQNTNNFA